MQDIAEEEELEENEMPPIAAPPMPVGTITCPSLAGESAPENNVENIERALDEEEEQGEEEEDEEEEEEEEQQEEGKEEEAVGQHDEQKENGGDAGNEEFKLNGIVAKESSTPTRGCSDSTLSQGGAESGTTPDPSISDGDAEMTESWTEENGKEGGGRWRKCSTLARCGTACAKTYLVTVNVVLFMIGVLMTVGGVLMYYYYEYLSYSVLFLDNPTTPLIVLDRFILLFVTIGVLATSTGFVGCCGAFTESNCCLSFFSTLIVTSLLLQLIVTLVAVSTHQQIRSSLLTSMAYQIQYQYNTTARYSDDTDTLTYRVTTAWDNLQNKLQCCGAFGPQDYHHSLWFNHTMHSTGGFVPPSCCIDVISADVMAALRDQVSSAQDESLQADYLCQLQAVQLQFPMTTKEEISDVKTTGCGDAIIDWFFRHLPLLIFVVVADVVQVSMLLYSCGLMARFRRQHLEDSIINDHYDHD